jgi:hypothetical protein
MQNYDTDVYATIRRRCTGEIADNNSSGGQCRTFPTRNHPSVPDSTIHHLLFCVVYDENFLVIFAITYAQLVISLTNIIKGCDVTYCEEQQR